MIARVQPVRAALVCAALHPADAETTLCGCDPPQGGSSRMRSARPSARVSTALSFKCLAARTRQRQTPGLICRHWIGLAGFAVVWTTHLVWHQSSKAEPSGQSRAKRLGCVELAVRSVPNRSVCQPTPSLLLSLPSVLDATALFGRIDLLLRLNRWLRDSSRSQIASATVRPPGDTLKTDRRRDNRGRIECWMHGAHVSQGLRAVAHLWRGPGRARRFLLLTAATRRGSTAIAVTS